MTAREYAKERGVNLVGKLTKKTEISLKWDWKKCKEVEVRQTYYEDEAGTQIMGNKTDGWCLITAEDDVY